MIFTIKCKFEFVKKGKWSLRHRFKRYCPTKSRRVNVAKIVSLCRSEGFVSLAPSNGHSQISIVSLIKDFAIFFRIRFYKVSWEYIRRDILSNNIQHSFFSNYKSSYVRSKIPIIILYFLNIRTTHSYALNYVLSNNIFISDLVETTKVTYIPKVNVKNTKYK